MNLYMYKCVPCVILDPSFGILQTCIFCNTRKLAVYGTMGNSCRSCTSGFPEKAAIDKAAAEKAVAEKAAIDKVAADKAAAEIKAATDKAVMDTIPRMDARLGKLEAEMGDSLSRVDDAVVLLERSLGERMRALEGKVGVVQSDIAALPRGHSDDRLAALQGAIVQIGQELCQVGQRVARQEELSQAILERMARQEELAQTRDANIQALLLRLLP